LTEWTLSRAMQEDERTTSDAIVPEIAAYYGQRGERDRLLHGRGELERIRTQELLTRQLPAPPASVLDVGGGAGVHAFWLAGQGYEVHLLDPMPEHIEQALEHGAQPGVPALASARLGDARRLDLHPETVDVVLLLGPLYHLTERTDRLLALREARRVLRPGGLLCAAGISRFASLFDSLASRLYDDPEFARVVEQDLRDGQHRNPSGRSRFFTTAYFHHPNELADEVTEAGLALVELAGIEGPGHWMVGDFDTAWAEAAGREHILAAARAIEHEPALLGLGPHIMVIARKQ
jgi:ubiquinone/menaquinone biosynthesis C-methylase UbiE